MEKFFKTEIAGRPLIVETGKINNPFHGYGFRPA